MSDICHHMSPQNLQVSSFNLLASNVTIPMVFVDSRVLDVTVQALNFLEIGIFIPSRVKTPQESQEQNRSR